MVTAVLQAGWLLGTEVGVGCWRARVPHGTGKSFLVLLVSSALKDSEILRTLSLVVWGAGWVVWVCFGFKLRPR